MGGDGDPDAVVDPTGAVRGVTKLSITDASIFPEIPSTPINLTAVADREQRKNRAASATAGGLPVPRRYWAILTVSLAITMSVLDSTIVNVALPTIARDLGTAPAASIWVVNGYQLAVIITLLPLAALGDILEYRRVYRVGLLVFTVASLACALSSSLVALSMARILQGVGAAGITSVDAALLRFIWPRASLGRGIGINALVVAVAAALGPTFAAGILAVAPWPWLFAVNVPIGILALLATPALPPTRRANHRFDPMAAVLNALTFGFFIVAIDSIGHGEETALAVLESAVAAVAGIILIRRELASARPVLPVDLLRIPIFALSVSTSVCSFTGQMLAYVSLPFYFEDVLGRSAVATGLLMTAWPLTTAVVAPIAGRLADRYPAGLLGSIGLTAFAAGLALLAGLPADPSNLAIAWRMVVCGFGFGLFQSPNNRAMIAAAPAERSGGASGMLNTARLLGQTAGAALTALIFTRFPAGGTMRALALAAVVAATGAIVSSLRLTGPRSAQARKAKEQPER